ncbi:hypothetical protein K474DRAFT_328950 [Panus rudis PR-1116 ss-1]|nr:hypothetical protein K474DRAFT_328950 [Panus rudis PR-1116 ss-1]
MTFLLDEKGVRQCSLKDIEDNIDVIPRYLPTRTWYLFDDRSKDRIPNFLALNSSTLFFVATTSPKQSRIKSTSAPKWWMDPWTPEEVALLLESSKNHRLVRLMINAFAQEATETAEEIADKSGKAPVAFTVRNPADDSDGDTFTVNRTYLQLMGEAICEVIGPCVRDIPPICYKVHDNGDAASTFIDEDEIMYSFKSKTIRQFVLHRNDSLEQSELIRYLAACRRLGPSIQTLSGHLFEHWAISCIRLASSGAYQRILPLSPMVEIEPVPVNTTAASQFSSSSVPSPSTSTATSIPSTASPPERSRSTSAKRKAASTDTTGASRKRAKDSSTNNQTPTVSGNPDDSVAAPVGTTDEADEPPPVHFVYVDTSNAPTGRKDAVVVRPGKLEIDKNPAPLPNTYRTPTTDVRVKWTKRNLSVFDATKEVTVDNLDSSTIYTSSRHTNPLFDAFFLEVDENAAPPTVILWVLQMTVQRTHNGKASGFALISHIRSRAKMKWGVDAELRYMLVVPHDNASRRVEWIFDSAFNSKGNRGNVFIQFIDISQVPQNEIVYDEIFARVSTTST